MVRFLQELRRFALTPRVAETTFAVRGFHEKTRVDREMLEKVGRMFLIGYGHAAESSTAAAVDARLSELPDEFRGFGYEGAGMALAIRDGLPIGHGHHVADFLSGYADRHIYMVYVGIGWALARLPRFRWSAVSAGATDVLLRWLLLDGYGFHQAYFATAKYVREQFQDTAFAWPLGCPSQYSSRVIDQGIGRAMWFVTGADPDVLGAAVARFPAERRADLYSGVGLAATYAGGVDETELGTLVKHAGLYRGSLAQGSAFAAEARVRADLVVPHVELATQVICGLGAEDAAVVTRRTKPVEVPDGDVPAYEVWRRSIASEIGQLNGY